MAHGMYQPPHFRETDLPTQHGLIVSHPLGLLISPGLEGILANPVPFVLHPELGERGTLRCHLARANPQLQALADKPDALVVFQGAERYITPSWYASKAEHGKVVPTWNYAIVQARGVARLQSDPAWLRTHVSTLSDTREAGRDHPWALDDAPEAFVQSQLKGIVGIEIEIAAIEGKWKVSQNRPEPDRAGVVAGLMADGDETAIAMADMVAAGRRG